MFYIIVNKKKRDALGIVSGDIVDVELVKDESKYGLPMPEDFQEVLNQDPEADRLFHALTAGKQRSVLYHIGNVKNIDRRIHVALIFIEHLKNNDGKIVPDLATTWTVSPDRKTYTFDLTGDMPVNTDGGKMYGAEVAATLPFSIFTSAARCAPALWPISTILLKRSGAT